MLGAVGTMPLVFLVVTIFLGLTPKGTDFYQFTFSSSEKSLPGWSS